MRDGVYINIDIHMHGYKYGGNKSMNHLVSVEEIEEILNINKIVNSENKLRRFPIEHEKNMLENVRLGKYRDIRITDFEVLSSYMGISTCNRFRKFEYTTVASITLCTRAAIEGGLLPDDAYDIGEAMFQRLENAKTINELHDIMELTAVILAREVHKTKSSKSSYVLEQCKNYISRNIFNRIYLNEIAQYVGVNPSYLSRFFSEKERITIQKYIQREKARIACNLLKHSDRTIAEIAQYMGFQSQSSFSKMFKQWEYLSPLEYRNQNYQDHYTNNKTIKNDSIV